MVYLVKDVGIYQKHKNDLKHYFRSHYTVRSLELDFNQMWPGQEINGI